MSIYKNTYLDHVTDNMLLVAQAEGRHFYYSSLNSELANVVWGVKEEDAKKNYIGLSK